MLDLLPDLGLSQRRWLGSPLESNGLSVVSDIDDTIKLSQVRDRTELLRNTFLREYQPVPGLASICQSWATNRQAQFHYLSASPWQLFGPLTNFLHLFDRFLVLDRTHK